MNKIILFEKKENCCGCGACINTCPKQAIIMEEDEFGFLYPMINEELCIECGACKKVCAYQNTYFGRIPIKTFVAVNKNKRQLLASASGGVFAAVATKIIKSGGVVFGAVLDFDNGHAVPHHISIDNLADLYKLQGSKYVQSSMGGSYKEVQNFLKQDRQVLFSGTPCQISGLLGFLKKDYENLITIDLICHGVPNARFFDDYIQIEKDKRKVNQVIGYAFRDKRKGWGMNGRLDLRNKNGRVRSVYVPARLNSYNTLFLDGYTYRENCYSCKFACTKRIGDLTIGDYWGIENAHPELMGKYGYDEHDGISCILANTEKGVQLCGELDEVIRMDQSILEKVTARNGQLTRPAKKVPDREKVLELYQQNGYIAVEDFFKKKFRKQIIIHRIYNTIPRAIRLKLKKALKG